MASMALEATLSTCSERSCATHCGMTLNSLNEMSKVVIARSWLSSPGRVESLLNESTRTRRSFPSWLIDAGTDVISLAARSRTRMSLVILMALLSLPLSLLLRM